MDSKNTKAMAVTCTGQQLPKRALRSGTVEASPGSKNTCEAHLKGLEAERVALEYLRAHHEAKLLRHRYRSPWGEVDLLLRLRTGEIAMVEVKCLSSFERIQTRLGKSQKARLKRIFLWFSERAGPTVFWLVFVTPTAEVLVLEDVFG